MQFGRRTEASAQARLLRPDFAFTTAIANGGSYNVTVLTQPSSPAQTCAVTAGNGTASANVTSVQIACTTNSTANEWTWMGGSIFTNQTGTYVTLGTPAPGNVPGARNGAVSWRDTAGNFWHFGGSGIDSTGASGGLNDLWKYSAGEWTWVSGSNVANQQGTYGTQGMADPNNVPGARGNSVSWIDAAGNFWRFGGRSLAYLNDLWKYSGGEWTWMGGSNLGDQSGTYGTQGTPAPGNVPGGRENAIRWTDAAGNFWLFGGDGYDSVGTLGRLNDLWKSSSSQIHHPYKFQPGMALVAIL